MPDIFDRIKLDIFDRVDLPPEEKVMHSPDFKKAIAAAVQEKIASLPLDKLISAAVDDQVRKRTEHLDDEFLKKKRSDESFKRTLTETLEKAKAELEERLTKKHDEIVNKINAESSPRYQFGGYPPPGGGLPIPGAGGLMEWRFIVDGMNLSVQKLENGVWVEKASFLP